jgi:hypothetical protein
MGRPARGLRKPCGSDSAAAAAAARSSTPPDKLGWSRRRVTRRAPAQETDSAPPPAPLPSPPAIPRTPVPSPPSILASPRSESGPCSLAALCIAATAPAPLYEARCGREHKPPDGRQEAGAEAAPVIGRGRAAAAIRRRGAAIRRRAARGGERGIEEEFKYPRGFEFARECWEQRL